MGAFGAKSRKRTRGWSNNYELLRYLGSQLSTATENQHMQACRPTNHKANWHGTCSNHKATCSPQVESAHTCQNPGDLLAHALHSSQYNNTKHTVEFDQGQSSIKLRSGACVQGPPRQEKMRWNKALEGDRAMFLVVLKFVESFFTCCIATSVVFVLCWLFAVISVAIKELPNRVRRGVCRCHFLCSICRMCRCRFHINWHCWHSACANIQQLCIPGGCTRWEVNQSDLKQKLKDGLSDGWEEASSKLLAVAHGNHLSDCSWNTFIYFTLFGTYTSAFYVCVENTRRHICQNLWRICSKTSSAHCQTLNGHTPQRVCFVGRAALFLHLWFIDHVNRQGVVAERAGFAKGCPGSPEVGYLQIWCLHHAHVHVIKVSPV